jgi:hypothetical protein
MVLNGVLNTHLNRESSPPSSRKSRCEAVDDMILLTARVASRCIDRCLDRMRKIITCMALPLPERCHVIE